MKLTERLRPLLAAFALGASAPVAAQDAFSLHIEGLAPSTNAPVIVRIYDRDGWLKPEKAMRTLRLHPQGRASVSCTLPLPVGHGGPLAIEAFQDLNGNGKMDMHWFPLPGPEEPVGFPNGYRPLAKPRFDKAVVRADAGSNVIVIRLRR